MFFVTRDNGTTRQGFCKMLPSRDCHEVAKNVANAQFWLHYLALTTSLSHLVQYAVYDLLAKVTIAPYYPPPPKFSRMLSF